MADNRRYLALKTKLNNNFLVGDDKTPMTIVDVKRVLSNFSAPVDSNVDSKAAEAADGTGLAFVEL